MVLHGPPWFYLYSHCHQMVTKQQPKCPIKSLEVT